jgi:hypothetical protein
MTCVLGRFTVEDLAKWKLVFEKAALLCQNFLKRQNVQVYGTPEVGFLNEGAPLPA